MIDSHNEDWNPSEKRRRQRLSVTEYQALRQAGIKRASTGEYTDTKTQGVYCCRICGYELFRSNEKFDSCYGWSSFFSPLVKDWVIERRDTGLGIVCTGVLCSRCKSHLGHVSKGKGYNASTDLRYCINSISLTPEPDKMAEQLDEEAVPLVKVPSVNELQPVALLTLSCSVQVTAER